MSRRGRVPSPSNASKHREVARSITKNDPNDPKSAREHARIMDREARRGRARVSTEQAKMVHAAREMLGRDRKQKAVRKRKKQAKVSRRTNR